MRMLLLCLAAADPLVTSVMHLQDGMEPLSQACSCLATGGP